MRDDSSHVAESKKSDSVRKVKGCRSVRIVCMSRIEDEERTVRGRHLD